MEHLKNAFSVFLVFLMASFFVAIVLVIQILIWLFIPGVIYWVIGWFTDNEMWRFGFACAAFAGFVFRDRGNFLKLIERKLCDCEKRWK